MTVFLAAVVLCFSFSACSKKNEEKSFFRYDEKGKEYQTLARDYMSKYVAGQTGLVDTVKVEGENLYLRFSTKVENYNYKDFAKKCAVEFNKFKRKTLGYTGVVVYCITDSGTIAHAIAQ
jgi:hypothetical protein